MATSRDINITDLFPTASLTTSPVGSEEISIPLADLSAEGGLDAIELAADDARKIFFAILRTGAKALEDISSAYDTRINALQTWAAGKEFTSGQEVQQSGVIYQATSDHTASSTFAADAGNWSEQSVTAPPNNFKSAINPAQYGSGDFGTATVTQSMQFTATYSGTTDLKDE